MKLLYKLISQMLIVCMILLPFSAQAGMIGTDQAVASAQDLVNHARVIDFMSRGDVIQKFEALGLSAATAHERVNAMTQQEINQIAGKIDTLPAGATASAWWLLAIAIIAFVIWTSYKR